MPFTRVEDVDQCDYDLVADDDFVLGAIPGAANAFVGVGWRGTGYKFAPWVGRVLAELAVSGRQPSTTSTASTPPVSRMRPPPMPRPTRTLQQRLTDGVVIGAEGYVFELERRGYVKAGPFVPEVILDAPDAVRQLHREFLRAGADVMVALTYYAHRDKLRDVGREGDLEAMNRAAVRIANEVAAEGDALVAGNICNTWSFDPKRPGRFGAVVRAQYEEQLGWAVEEGIDFVIAETNDYVGEALIALEVCQQLGLPAMVTFASVQPEITYDGYDYVEACRVLADEGAALVGLNCSRGPETMLPLLERIRAAVDVPVAAQPVPYRTTAAHAGLRVARVRGGAPGVPDRARAVWAHALRDGGVRRACARHRRRLRRHLLRRRAAPRPGDGRGPRPHAPGQPLLPGDGAAPRARRRRPAGEHGPLGTRQPRRSGGPGMIGALDEWTR